MYLSYNIENSTKLVGKCDVRRLKNAEENYPAWLEAIENAQNKIYFESCIIHDDAQGERFGDVRIEKTRQEIEVKLIYDWMSGFGKTFQNQIPNGRSQTTSRQKKNISRNSTHFASRSYLFRLGFHLAKRFLHRSRTALIASDHLPIVAEFSF